MPYRDDHAAILVGINRYGDSDLKDLDGPPNDIALMKRWLADEHCGGVRKTNIFEITSDPAILDKRIDPKLPPLVEDFMDKFMSLVEAKGGNGWNRRPAGRVYLYFAGHGFCEKMDDSAHAALYAANCRIQRGPHYNIYGTAFAKWIKQSGLFGEVVLIMDCCRDAEVSKVPTPPPLPRPGDVGVGNESRLLEIYAAPRGGKAHEREIPARDGFVHGLLTHALIDALENASPQKDQISSADIKAYIEQRWSAVCGSSPVNPPEIHPPGVGDILFDRPHDRINGVAQGFDVSRIPDGGRFSIVNGDLSPYREITVDRPRVAVSRADGKPVMDAQFDNEVLTLKLPVMLYKAVSANVPNGIVFQAGGEHVLV